VGREGHTFLHHIVANYDKLAAWTVFSQAGEPTEGYSGHQVGGGHMLTGASFDDYLLQPQRATAGGDPGAFFLITSKVHLATMQHALRTSFRTAEGQLVPEVKALPPRCPANTAPGDASSDTWGPYGDVPWLRSFVAAKCGLEESNLGDATLNFWDSFVQLPLPPAGIAHFAQGARFAASRARIQQRPRAYYEKLLALVSMEADPCVNYLFEWAWYYVIGKPASPPCEVSPDEEAQVLRMEERLLQAESGVSGISGVSGVSGISGAATPPPTPSNVSSPPPVTNPAPTPDTEVATEDTVITGSVTMTVEEPEAFCEDAAAASTFVATIANLTGLGASSISYDCQVAGADRRLSDGSRQLAEGSVIVTYSIQIPADAPSSTPTPDEVMATIESTSSDQLTGLLNTAFVANGVMGTVTVTDISKPTKKMGNMGTNTTNSTGVSMGSADSHARARAPMGACLLLVLALFVATAAR
jgi:hypothetical protein